MQIKEPTSAHLPRARHAIGISLRSLRVKELVGALEWSQNETVLGEILESAQEAGEKDTTVNYVAS